MNTVINPHFIASQGGYSRDRAITVYDRMKATSAVCVNDWEMARYILARGGTPILRIRCPDDDDADSRFDPVEYIDTCHTELSAAEAGIPGAAGKGRVHIGNELGSATKERTAAWLAKAIRRATFHKRKAVAANWSVKNPHESVHPVLAEYGVYDAINENGGEMGYHEGAYIDPKTGEVFRTFAECLAGGCIGGFREAQQQYGFRVCITEFASSKTPVDGWSTWMSENEFAALCDKAGQFYASLGVAAHVYSAFDWDRGTGFEYVDTPTLQDKFAQTNGRYPVTQPTVPTWQNHNWGTRITNATVKLSRTINVRAEPYEGSADEGDLANNATITYWTTPYKSTQGDKYNWYKVLFGGQERYVAEVAGLRFESLPTPVEKRISFTEAEVNAMRAQLAALQDLLNKGVPSDSGNTF